MLTRIREAAELEQALQAPRFLLFKHSTSCPISARAFEQYQQFLATVQTLPTAWLHVVEQRPLSREVESRTGLRHESPQALLLEQGVVRWHASHDAISAASLRQAVEHNLGA